MKKISFDEAVVRTEEALNSITQIHIQKSRLDDMNSKIKRKAEAGKYEPDYYRTETLREDC